MAANITAKPSISAGSTDFRRPSGWFLRRPGSSPRMMKSVRALQNLVFEFAANHASPGEHHKCYYVSTWGLGAMETGGLDADDVATCCAGRSWTARQVRHLTRRATHQGERHAVNDGAPRRIKVGFPRSGCISLRPFTSRCSRERGPWKCDLPRARARSPGICRWGWEPRPGLPASGRDAPA